MRFGLVDTENKLRLFSGTAPERVLVDNHPVHFTMAEKRKGHFVVVLDHELSPFDLVDFEVEGKKHRAYPAGILEEERFYYEGPLGYQMMQDYVEFNVWAPGHQELFVELYDPRNLGAPEVIEEMSRAENGVWTCRIVGDLVGRAYRYRIERAGRVYAAADPYAPAAIGNSEFSYIVDLSRLEPDGWRDDRGPHLGSIVDAVIYELHIGDFSSSWTTNHMNRGKYLAFCECGTSNLLSGPSGIDYIEKLGVTHLHLLPFQDFSSVDEFDPEYNWGYDPELHNVPEGCYSLDPSSGESRIVEVRRMIKSIHDRGLGVIMDVVYNHTYRNNMSFHKLVPFFYHRLTDSGSFSNGAGTGNELCTERFMVRRFITDSVLHWMRNYHVDGFRFDLMALLGEQTVKEIECTIKAERPDVVVYGEPWMAARSSMRDNPFVKGSQKSTRIAVFNDEFRDSIKGRLDDESRGFVSGSGGREEDICIGIAGSTAHSPGISGFAEKPGEIINYCSSHDNMTLWDKLLKSCSEEPFETRRRMALLALSIVITSQGVPFIHAGSETFRTKLFERDSYRSSLLINELNYNRISFYSESVDYISALIGLRKKEPLFRLRTLSEVQNKLRFIHAADHLVIFRLAEQCREYLVMHNASGSSRSCSVEGSWNILAFGLRADPGGLSEADNSLVAEPFSTTIALRQ